MSEHDNETAAETFEWIGVHGYAIGGEVGPERLLRLDETEAYEGED